MTPLIDFLAFINNSTDEEFAAKLTDYLDTDAFATYLASQELIHNEDDIDGPGNNSYLYYDSTSKKMTVVAWDHNLAFGGLGGAPMGGGNKLDKSATPPTNEEEKTPPKGMGTPPDITDQDRPEMPDGEEGQKDYGTRPTGDNMGGKENILVTRFLANDRFKKLYEEKQQLLTTSLIDSGYAASILKTYQELLTKNVTDLVAKESITNEAESISQLLTTDTTTAKTKTTTSN